MGQKVNPIAVRLGINRTSESNWFSDYYYSSLLYQDINFRDYISSIKQPNANKLGFRTAKTIIHYFPKKSFIHLFCLSDPREIVKRSGDNKLPHRANAGSAPTLARTTAPISWPSAAPTQVFSRPKRALRDALRPKRSASPNSGSTVKLEPACFAGFFGTQNGRIKSGAPAFKWARQCNASWRQHSFWNALEHINGSEISPFWLKSSSLQKKKGLTSLYRSQSLRASRYNEFFFNDRSRPPQAEYFHYYAMHYFFMKKTNKSYIKQSLSQIGLAPNNISGGRFGRGAQAIKEARPKRAANAVAPAVKNSLGVRFGRWGLDFYLSNVQFILSEHTKNFIMLRPIKVTSVFQSASLVAQEITCKLEQKKSFRIICRIIFQQLASCKYIKGIRIACSGRINGAEIAKTECRKFGETSLHVFSDKIDYACKRASTPYGILGVKVWISYV